MSRTDDALIAHLDESLRIECDGKGHSAGIDGHLPDQFASLSVTFKCPACGDALTGLLCRGRYNWLRRDAKSGSTVECEICERVSSLSDYMLNVVSLGDEVARPTEE